MKGRDFLFLLPLAALVGAVSPGSFWRGSLAALVLLLPAWWSIRALSGGNRRLLVLTALAFLLRLGAGAALNQLLPRYGYDNPTQNGGYVFYDAYRRDTQAWELAQSGQPLRLAFDRSTATDQYGGLLYLSALTYRILSPDAHRPLLIVLLGAWAAALGTPFLWRLAADLGDERTAWLAVGWYVFYPEAVLQGASQMREPFLMSAVLWLTWSASRVHRAAARREAWAAGGAGLLLLLAFSPGVAAYALLGAALTLIWTREKRLPLWTLAAAALASLLALGVFSAQVAAGQGNLLARSLRWLQEAAGWDMYLLTRQSGWVQKLLGEMPSRYHVLFVAGFGLAQPVLPGTLIEPAAAIWHGINFLRAAGWYALVAPLLVAVPLAWTDRSRRGRLLLSLALLSWAWIVLASLRAGGDQWDNPRYRVIFLGWQALVAAWGWRQARRRGSPWPWRVLSAEIIFLLFFGEWYLSRYTAALPRLPFWQMVAAIWGLTLLAWLGDWLRRRKRA